MLILFVSAAFFPLDNMYQWNGWGVRARGPEGVMFGRRWTQFRTKSCDVWSQCTHFEVSEHYHDHEGNQGSCEALSGLSFSSSDFPFLLMTCKSTRPVSESTESMFASSHLCARSQKCSERPKFSPLAALVSHNPLGGEPPVSYNWPNSAELCRLYSLCG